MSGSPLRNTTIAPTANVPEMFEAPPLKLKSNEIIVEYSAIQNLTASCKIINIQGQIVYNKNEEFKKGNYNITLNYPELKKGIYFFQLSIAGTKCVKKFCVV